LILAQVVKAQHSEAASVVSSNQSLLPSRTLGHSDGKD
jgi:hypothetical protein